ncbi:DMT family transporter [bacterium]|nr:DMT family transporter [bacterium]
MTLVRRAEWMLLLVTVCWGVSFPSIKAATAYCSPTLFVAVRFTAATLILLAGWPLFARSLPDDLRRRGRGLIADRQAIRWGLLLGVLVAVGYTTQTIGMHTTTANNSAFITALSVVLVPLIIFCWHGVRPSASVIGGVALALAGLWLLTQPNLKGIVAGDVWTVGCAVSYAFYLSRLNFALVRTSYLPLLFWTLAVCTVLNGLWAVLIEDMRFEPNGTLLTALIVTTLLSTLAGLYLQNRYQGYTSPSRAALIFAAEPVFATFFSWLAIGERLTGAAIPGAGLILAAVLTVELGGAGDREDGLPRLGFPEERR